MRIALDEDQLHKLEVILKEMIEALKEFSSSISKLQQSIDHLSEKIQKEGFSGE